MEVTTNISYTLKSPIFVETCIPSIILLFVNKVKG